jgi:hypothetical protein
MIALAKSVARRLGYEVHRTRAGQAVILKLPEAS